MAHWHGSTSFEALADAALVIEAVFEDMAAKKAVFAQLHHEEIVRRYLAAMVNEGARVVHEGIAMRPLDVDVTLFRGFAEQDPLFWAPSPLLVALVAQGAGFASLNDTP